MKRLIVFLAIVVLNIFFTVVLLASVANAEGWTTVGVTAYSQTENLTGCTGRTDPHNGKQLCYTACPKTPHLHDNEFTVAANPWTGYHCGDKVRYLKWANGRFYRHNATVTDTTACTLWFCSFEFSRALAYATGQTPNSWDNPRWISMKRGWLVAKAAQSRSDGLIGVKGSSPPSSRFVSLERLRTLRPKTVKQTCPGALFGAKYYRLRTWIAEDRLQQYATTAGYKAGHRTRSCRAARQQVKNWIVRAHRRERLLRWLNNDPVAAINYVFGVRGLESEARTVAQCESGFSTGAGNGQFTGIFQLGTDEKNTFAIWRGGYRYDTAIDQVRAADRMQRSRGWGSWQCSEHGGLRW